MKYYNLNHKDEKVSFEQASVKGQGKDKGLFFPESVPQFEKSFIENLPEFSNEEIAFRCMKDFAGDEIPEAVLRSSSSRFTMMRSCNGRIFMGTSPQIG